MLILSQLHIKLGPKKNSKRKPFIDDINEILILVSYLRSVQKKFEFDLIIVE